MGLEPLKTFSKGVPGVYAPIPLLHVHSAFPGGTVQGLERLPGKDSSGCQAQGTASTLLEFILTEMKRSGCLP